MSISLVHGVLLGAVTILEHIMNLTIHVLSSYWSKTNCSARSVYFILICVEIVIRCTIQCEWMRINMCDYHVDYPYTVAFYTRHRHSFFSLFEYRNYHTESIHINILLPDPILALPLMKTETFSYCEFIHCI